MDEKAMFDCKSWIKEAEILLKKLHECDFGYRLHENTIEPPDYASQISDTTVGGNRSLPQVKEFYSFCNGISWPDVYNGYYTIKKEEFGKIWDEFTPTLFKGVSAGEVLFFGSSGGGDYFVLMKTTGQVAIIPSLGGIRQNIYDNSEDDAKIVADDFYGFLTWLLEDLRAYVNQDPDHEFCTDAPYKKYTPSD